MKKETILEIIIVLLVAALCFVLFSRPNENKAVIQAQHVIDSLQTQMKVHDAISDNLKKNILHLDSLIKAASNKPPEIIIKYEKEGQRILHLNADDSIELLSEYLSQ